MEKKALSLYEMIRKSSGLTAEGFNWILLNGEIVANNRKYNEQLKGRGIRHMKLEENK